MEEQQTKKEEKDVERGQWMLGCSSSRRKKKQRPSANHVQQDGRLVGRRV